MGTKRQFCEKSSYFVVFLQISTPATRRTIYSQKTVKNSGLAKFTKIKPSSQR
jgi:hypothetical protein